MYIILYRLNAGKEGDAIAVLPSGAAVFSTNELNLKGKSHYEFILLFDKLIKEKTTTTTELYVNCTDRSRRIRVT